MPELKIEYTLILSEREAINLKTVLGKMSLNDYRTLGLSDNEAAEMSGIYDLLPHPEED